MKQILLFLIIALLVTIFLRGQDINPGCESALAIKFRADDYIMKSSVLVILKTCKKEIKDTQARDSLFVGHYENIYRLVDDCKLLAAGPLASNVTLFNGVFILNIRLLKRQMNCLSQT